MWADALDSLDGVSASADSDLARVLLLRGLSLLGRRRDTVLERVVRGGLVGLSREGEVAVPLNRNRLSTLRTASDEMPVRLTSFSTSSSVRSVSSGSLVARGASGGASRPQSGGGSQGTVGISLSGTGAGSAEDEAAPFGALMSGCTGASVSGR